jgi:AraC-like DNA-binding protein
MAMDGLERTSHGGRLRHAPGEHLPRHAHGRPFAALVLSGGYVEAGDTGRHRMEAGDILFHRAWESHLDRFDGRGAEVLVLAIQDDMAGLPAARVADADAIVRLAEDDPLATVDSLLEALLPKPAAPDDWPDLLAQAIRDDPSLCVTRWAEASGLHIGSVSRGFRQVFGMTPVSYRLAQRTRRAIDTLMSTEASLCAIAQDCGFADQAHMSRAVSRIARVTPGVLRKAPVRPLPASSAA